MRYPRCSYADRYFCMNSSLITLILELLVGCYEIVAYNAQSNLEITFNICCHYLDRRTFRHIEQFRLVIMKWYIDMLHCIFL